MGRDKVTLESVRIVCAGKTLVWAIGDEPEHLQHAIDYLAVQKAHLLTEPQKPLPALED